MPNYPIFLLLAIPTAVGAFEQNFDMRGRDSAGVLEINADRVFDTARSDVAESVRFSFGLVLAHIGLPSLTAACTYTDYAGLLAGGEGGKAGYASLADTIWETADRIPPTLLEFDSLANVMAGNGMPGRKRGRGFRHSAEYFYGSCGMRHASVENGYNRIFYFRGNGDVHAKFQIRQVVLNAAPKVEIRYHITLDAEGRFREPEAGIVPRSSSSAFRKAAPYRFFRGFLLGRTLP